MAEKQIGVRISWKTRVKKLSYAGSYDCYFWEEIKVALAEIKALEKKCRLEKSFDVIERVAV